MKAAAYVRVSTEEQKLHGLSIDAQIDSLKTWAASNDVEIVGFYNDAGFSARKPYNKRPAMVQLLEDIQNGKVDLVIFTKLDRWFRSLKDYFKVQEILDANKVAWRATQEDYETVTASGRFKVNIMLSVAENEADRTSERIKTVFEAKRQRLEPLTGNCPLGYKIENKKYIKDPETETAVRAFFDKFLSTGMISRAQDYVREEYGLIIRYQTASKMLGTRTYCGYYFGKEGMCPPYITEEEHQKIQSMRKHQIRRTKDRRVYIFSGLVFCGECGARMNGNTNTRVKNFRAYYCQKHYQKRAGCNNKVCINEKDIESVLLDYLELKIKEKKSACAENMKTPHRIDHKNEIASLRSKIGKLKDLYLNDLITIEDYKAEKNSMEAKISELEELQSVSKPPDFLKIDGLLKAGWKEDYLSVSRESKSEFWRIIIKKITVKPDRSITFELNV